MGRKTHLTICHRYIFYCPAKAGTSGRMEHLARIDLPTQPKARPHRRPQSGQRSAAPPPKKSAQDIMHAPKLPGQSASCDDARPRRVILVVADPIGSRRWTKRPRPSSLGRHFWAFPSPAFGSMGGGWVAFTVSSVPRNVSTTRANPVGASYIRPCVAFLN